VTKTPRVFVDRVETRPLQHERPVVTREAFRKPQLARRIRRVERERFQRSRPDALDVPAVEELMRGRAQRAEVLVGNPDAHRVGEYGAVAMLHPVGARPWQKIRDKRVGGLEWRQLAKDGAFFTHDPLQRCGETIRIGVAAVVVQCHSKFAIHRERPQRKRTQLDRAVDQIGEIGRRKRPRIGGRMQLGRGLPRGRRVERHTRGATFEPARPHERRRNIQMRVCRVDREMRSIQRVTEYFVAHAHRAAMRRHIPL
jgi:hypothetical protein